MAAGAVYTVDIFTTQGNTTFTGNTADIEGGEMGCMARHAPMRKIAVESMTTLRPGYYGERWRYMELRVYSRRPPRRNP